MLKINVNKLCKTSLKAKTSGFLKKYDGKGLMLFDKQRKYLNRKKEIEKKELKKKKDRLRYLKKKEGNGTLSDDEAKEKVLLENILCKT